MENPYKHQTASFLEGYITLKSKRKVKKKREIISKSVIGKGFGDGFVPHKIFYAILHSAISAASKLRTTVHDIRRMLFFIT
jgi:hypothetical protein